MLLIMGEEIQPNSVGEKVFSTVLILLGSIQRSELCPERLKLGGDFGSFRHLWRSCKPTSQFDTHSNPPTRLPPL